MEHHAFHDVLFVGVVIVGFLLAFQLGRKLTGWLERACGACKRKDKDKDKDKDTRVP